MAIDILRRLLLLCVFCVAQSLVLNHIHLFGFATPLLYVYMVLSFPMGYPKWAVLLWSFALGLAIDTFSNTPGVASASLTLIGAIQPYFFALFVQRDEPESIRPSVQSLGLMKYSFYVFVLVLLYCVVFFALEMFSFFHWLWWLECVGGSTLLTVLLVLTLESVRKR